MLIIWFGFLLMFREIKDSNEFSQQSNAIGKRILSKDQIDMDIKNSIYKILYMAAYFNQINLLTKDDSEELEKEVAFKHKSKLEQEKKNEIYRKHLASRVKSSLANDFLTMRYLK